MKIADYSVDQMKLAQASVSNNRIQNGAVDSRTIADGSVTTSKLDDGAVTSGKIGYHQVDTDNINDFSVTTEKLDDEAVTTYNIKDGAVTGKKIAEGAVDTVNLYDLAVNSEKIAWSAVENRHIYPGAITADKIADRGITADNINFCNYSTEPVKIGTWVDGRAIYRLCWDTTFTDLMISDKLVGCSDFDHDIKYENIINAHMYYGPDEYNNSFELLHEMWSGKPHISLFVVPDEVKVGDRLWGYVEYLEKKQ